MPEAKRGEMCLMRGFKAITAAITLLALSAGQAAATEIHAHRGAPIENGQAVVPENAMSGFHRVAQAGTADYVEIDVKTTADGVLVNHHDATLDRTTNCTGPVKSVTFAYLEANCRLDVLGIVNGDTGAGQVLPITNPTEKIPSLSEILDAAKSTGMKVNVEIKNVPTDAPHFDPDPAHYVTPIIDMIEAKDAWDLVLLQTFWPADLEYAQEYAQSAYGETPRTHILTLSRQSGAPLAFTELGLPGAVALGWSGLGPQWPPSANPAAYVAAAHTADLDVVPFTVDDLTTMQQMKAIGVDGIITNDVVAAQPVR